MRLLIVGTFSGGNWGDMTILTAVVAEARRRWPDCTIYVPTRIPGAVAQWVPEATPVLSVPLFSAALLPVLADVDAVLMTAGLYSVAEHPQFWALARCARLVNPGVLVAAVNAGYTTPATDAERLLMGDWLRQHHRLAVRDKDSADAVHTLAPDVEVSTFADMAHLAIPTLAPCAPTYIGVNISYHVGKRANAICEVVTAAAPEAKLPVRLVATAAADYSLTEHLSNKWCLEVMRLPELGVRGAAEAVSEAALMVATRHHAVLLATALGVPTAAVAYAPKVRSYMAAIGLGDWVYEPTKTIKHLLPGAVARMRLQSSKLREALSGVNEKRAALARQGFDWATEGVGA